MTISKCANISAHLEMVGTKRRCRHTKYEQIVKKEVFTKM